MMNFVRVNDGITHQANSNERFFCGLNCVHIPLFVCFQGNLAHTKGKGINTMRNPRTPTRTITFAKVLSAALSIIAPNNSSYICLLLFCFALLHCCLVTLTHL